MSNQIYPTVRGLTWPVMMTAEMSTDVQISSVLSRVRTARLSNPVWHATLIYEYLKDDPSDVLAAYSPWTDYRALQDFLLSRQGRYDDFLLDCSMIGLNSEFYVVGPRVWIANQPHVVGDIVIDPSGHIQTVTIPGLSAASAPTWNDVGGTTVDGTVTWQDGGLFSGGLAQVVPTISDGAASPTYYSPIQRVIGGFNEDITDLNVSQIPLTVWDNGVLKTNITDYTLLGPGLGVPGFASRGLYVKWVATPTTPVTMSCQFYLRMRAESDIQDMEQFLQRMWTIGGSGSKNGSGMIKLISSRLPL